MRVTNSMISNSSRTHITTAKNELMKRENQYTTQKKILRPSEDPTVAIRSLQLRTTYGMIVQYVDKNVQDALEWVDTTEGALMNIQKALELIKPKFEQGVNDYLEIDERHAVLADIQKIVDGIFEDNANADYAGRYMFTGYRTDTSLLFPSTAENMQYQITENFDSNDIKTVKYVYREADTGDTADDYAANPPAEHTAYRMHLAYKGCSANAPNDLNENFDLSEPIEIILTDPTNPEDNLLDGYSIETRSLSEYEGDIYSTEDADIVYIPETGEVIFSDGAYKTVWEQFKAEPKSSLSITYGKEGFERGDIRPEMYFECKSHDTISENFVSYRDPSGQDIRYEVNFSQTATVNVQARDAIDTDIYRMLDYVRQTVEAMDTIENKIKDVETLIANDTTGDTSDLEKLKKMYEQEMELRRGCMSEAFGMGLTMVDNAERSVNVSIADLGARANRLKLTYDKLLDQSVDTEEKLSNNEDVDLADAYINLNQADLLYQAALSATAKILGNSLLNYI